MSAESVKGHVSSMPRRGSTPWLLEAVVGTLVSALVSPGMAALRRWSLREIACTPTQSAIEGGDFPFSSLSLSLSLSLSV